MALLTPRERRQIESVREGFFADADGLRAVEARTRTVDDLLRDRFERVFGSSPGVAAVAVGGYGRGELFPSSDVDLLLLFSSLREVEKSDNEIGRLIASLWDAKLQVSQSVRTPRDCTSLARDNTELHISLLDTRFVAGDEGFLRELQEGTLPRFYLREQRSLMRALTSKARARHKSYEDTMYHLEPNVKEGPGGLRDLQFSCWVAQLENVSGSGIPACGEFLPAEVTGEIDEARRLLFAVRCYLHYLYGRDRNILTFGMQDSIATEADGKAFRGSGVTDMMRTFYRRSRSVHRLALHSMEAASQPTNTLLSILRKRKSRLSNREFAVTKGQIYFKDPYAIKHSPECALRLFEFQARHGLRLASQTERRLRAELPALRRHIESSSGHWARLREIFRLPHTVLALSAMRESGFLFCLIPEFEQADCLVIHDFYHRYTVDEHTIVAVRILKDLARKTDGIDRRFAELLAEVRAPEIVCLALLYHDLGKAVKGKPHAQSSAEMANAGMQRLGLDDEIERKTVDHLIRDHLAMSTVMTKQDLGEPSVLEAFKERVGTLERLNMLTVMTYADMVAVNPSAALQWRKQLLWRLHRGTRAVFKRDHGDKRIRSATVADYIGRIGDADEREGLASFVRGFPERYVRTHTAEDVRRHAALASRLEAGAAKVECQRLGAQTEIVVVCADRPALFASLCAGITASGGYIVSAEAYSQIDGLILDKFRIIPTPGGDLLQFGTRGLQEMERRLERLAVGRLIPEDLVFIRPRRSKKRPTSDEPPLVTYDNRTSARSTIFSVYTRDRNKLLHDLSSVFPAAGCDIDVVLCHTQGGVAMDTFYVRKNGAKLDEATCETLRGRLVGACEAPAH